MPLPVRIVPPVVSRVPPTPAALDLIEFLHKRASEPIVIGKCHDYLGHHHLTFDRKRGQEAFREQVNTIFRRNGLAYELGAGGRVKRLLGPVTHALLRRGLPPSGDAEPDKLIAKAESGRKRIRALRPRSGVRTPHLGS